MPGTVLIASQIWSHFIYNGFYNWQFIVEEMGFEFIPLVQVRAEKLTVVSNGHDNLKTELTGWSRERNDIC